MKKVLIAVTNDLTSDQRVHKVATSLTNAGFEVLLIGRQRRNSKTLSQRSYETLRLNLLFEKGPLFYAEYNIRLFFYILFSKFDIIISNDLDTLTGSFLASKLRFKKLVYDSHEFFTEVPELINRKNTRKFWLFIEKFFLPHVKYSYTVCESIAKIYSAKYGINMKVVRNLPLKIDTDSLSQSSSSKIISEQIEQILKFIKGQKIVLYQGSLNTGRGIELVIKAMKYIENAIFLIVGEGDITLQLKTLAKTECVENKVFFSGKIPLENLYHFTKLAHAGISLEENIGLNYYYSLPNKLFDYIQARIPVLVSDFPEMKKIVTDFNIGLVAENRSPEDIANYLYNILNNQELRAIWEVNLNNSASELCWENEDRKLIEIFGKVK